MEPATYDPVVAALESLPRIIVPLVREMPEQLRKRRPRTGKWSAHENACHLASLHPLFFERLELMLEKKHPVLRPISPIRATRKERCSRSTWTRLWSASHGSGRIWWAGFGR